MTAVKSADLKGCMLESFRCTFSFVWRKDAAVPGSHVRHAGPRGLPHLKDRRVYLPRSASGSFFPGRQHRR